MKDLLTWQYNLDTEILRLLFTASRLKQGFYQKNNFVVLPKLAKEKGKKYSNPDLVVFPRFPMILMKNFWKFVPNFFDLPNQAEKAKLVGFLKERLGEYIEIKKERLERKRKEWGAVEKDFWKIIETSLPNLEVMPITAHVSSYGSMCSFGSNISYIYPAFTAVVRYDMPIDYLAESILSTIIFNDIEKKHIDMEYEFEVRVDTLFETTRLRDLFPEWRKSIELFRTKDAPLALQKKSKEYLANLKIKQCSVLERIGEDFYYKGKKIDKNLTRNELKILQLFFDNSGEVVSYSEIGRVLWGDKYLEKFSLAAIMKSVSRLKFKLKKIGISPGVVGTVGGRGYCWDG